MKESTSRFIKGSVYSIYSNIVVILIMTLISIFTARHLGREIMGLYSILLSLQGIVTIFAMFGIPPAMAKLLSEYSQTRKDARDDLVLTAFALVLAFSIVFASIYSLSREIISVRFYNVPELSPMIQISSAIVVILSVSTLTNSALQGFQRFRLLSRLTIINSVISLPVSIYLIYSWGITGALVALLVNYMVSAINNISHLWKILKEEDIKIRLCFNRRVARELIGFGMPMVLSGLVVIPGVWFANTTLAIYSGLGDVGLFAIAYTISNMLLFIPNAIAIPLIPLVSEFSAKDKREMNNLSLNTFYLIGILALPGSIFTCIFARDIVSVVYGSQFYGSWMILCLMAIAIYLVSLCSVIGNIIIGLGKTWDSFILNALWFISFIIAAHYLIMAYGLSGVGYAYIASYLFFIIILQIYMKYKQHVVIKNFSLYLIVPLIILLISLFIPNSIYYRVAYFLIFLLIGIVLSRKSRASLRGMWIDLTASPNTKN
ncbi:MAG: flippase [Methanothrix sp.]|nr:MAG: flippase [Methanothrix sp.]